MERIKYNSETKSFSTLPNHELVKKLDKAIEYVDKMESDIQYAIESNTLKLSQMDEEYKLLIKVKDAIYSYNSLVRLVERMKSNNDELLVDSNYWMEEYDNKARTPEEAIKEYKKQVEDRIQAYKTGKTKHLKKVLDDMIKIFNSI